MFRNFEREADPSLGLALGLGSGDVDEHLLSSVHLDCGTNEEAITFEDLCSTFGVLSGRG